MATLSAIAKLPRPELSDPPNAPSAFTTLTDTLDKVVVPKFASASARDAAIPSPVAGQHAYLDDSDSLTVYSDSAARWMTYALGTTTTKAMTLVEQKPMTGTTTTLTAAVADVPGCTSTFTVVKSGAIAVVQFALDFETTASSAGVGIGLITVDAAAQTTQINFSGANTTAGARATCANTVITAPLSVGSHTIKMRSQITGTLGMRINGPHTSMTVTLFE